MLQTRMSFSIRNIGNEILAKKHYNMAISRSEALEATVYASAAKNIGIIEWREGDKSEAEVLFARALFAIESTLGPEHPQARGLHRLLNALRANEDPPTLPISHVEGSVPEALLHRIENLNAPPDVDKHERPEAAGTDIDTEPSFFNRMLIGLRLAGFYY